MANRGRPRKITDEDENSKKLKLMKKNIEYSHSYFKQNYESFHKFKKFVFETNLTEDEKSVLDDLKKPLIEFNFLEAYISRLLGEFSKAEPSIIVGNDELEPVDPEIISLVEGNLRHIYRVANQDSFYYDTYKDLMGGGFSTSRVILNYEGDKSFELIPSVERAFDPTLCGFDPLARNPSKSDGSFCYELFPIRARHLIELRPNLDISELKYSKEIGGFNWCYRNQQENIILLAYYYEKLKTKKKLVLLSNNKRMFLDEYEDKMEQWSHGAHIEQPAIIIDERDTYIQKIKRNEFIDNQILEEKETIFKDYPLIFIDGNSEFIKDQENGAVRQITRPYVYQAIGLQKLKNFSGQTLAAGIEDIVRHKFMYAVEGVPENSLDAYTDMQHASNLPFYAFKRDTNGMVTDVSVPPPREIQMTSLPQEVTETFFNCDKMAQSILGSYDSSLGANDNEISGRAIIASATQSNATAMPIITRFLQGLTSISQVIVDIIPEIHKRERNITISELDGKSVSKKVNGKNQPSLDYSNSNLNVTVKAGTNFEMQMQQALMAVFGLTKQLPEFGQFIQEEGIEVILENLNFRGSDILKKKAPEYMQKIKQKAQMAQQAQMQAMQNNPQIMKARADMVKINQQAKDDDEKNRLESIQKQLDLKELQLEEIRLRMDIDALNHEKGLDLAKALLDKEVKHSSIDESAHKHALELYKHSHQMNMDINVPDIKEEL